MTTDLNITGVQFNLCVAVTLVSLFPRIMADSILA